MALDFQSASSMLSVARSTFSSLISRGLDVPQSVADLTGLGAGNACAAWFSPAHRRRHG